MLFPLDRNTECEVDVYWDMCTRMGMWLILSPRAVHVCRHLLNVYYMSDTMLNMEGTTVYEI